MLTSFIEKNLHRAKYKILEDGTYFGEIPKVRGVWASAKTLEDCRSELREVFEEWMLLSLKKDKKIPGFSFLLEKRAYA